MIGVGIRISTKAPSESQTSGFPGEVGISWDRGVEGFEATHRDSATMARNSVDVGDQVDQTNDRLAIDFVNGSKKVGSPPSVLVCWRGVAVKSLVEIDQPAVKGVRV